MIVLDRVDHIDISHYDARDEHSTTIMLPGAEKAIEVTLPPLRPNDDDRRRAARHGNAVAERDWVDVGTGAGGILPLTRHVGPFLGHGHFHLAQLAHHVFFVLFELPALVFHFAFEP